ncbi:MAG: transporter ATP-binding protein [Herbinix sp.]|jgi:ABC-2 type transport system ATP-binding protein|nr:transporter ATP-binding protein [Herbinix sp.]
MVLFTDFSKSYSKKNVINKSNFELKNNKISFIMGPNGSGKTTLIKCMYDMEDYHGNISFNSTSVEQVRDKSLVIWDDCPFYTNLSGIDNLIIFSEGKKTKKQIINIAKSFIDYELLITKVKKYSYGQKKKLALILIDILEPEYLIMDEITNGLDYDAIRNLKDYIRNWSKKMTILLTGHQFGFYNDLIDDLFIIKNNQISLIVENFANSELKLEDIYDEEIHI